MTWHVLEEYKGYPCHAPCPIRWKTWRNHPNSHKSRGKYTYNIDIHILKASHTSISTNITQKGFIRGHTTKQPTQGWGQQNTKGLIYQPSIRVSSTKWSNGCRLHLKLLQYLLSWKDLNNREWANKLSRDIIFLHNSNILGECIHGA